MAASPYKTPFRVSHRARRGINPLLGLLFPRKKTNTLTGCRQVIELVLSLHSGYAVLVMYATYYSTHSDDDRRIIIGINSQ